MDLSDEASHDLWHAQGTQDIAGAFKAAAEHLRGTLEDELGHEVESEAAR